MSIVQEFVVETRENLEQVERDLVELERNPTARETLSSVFRAVHSIKGGTGFLGFSNLGAVAHVGESLLSRLRDGALVMNPDITSALLALVDCIRQMLSHIDQTGIEGKTDYARLVERLVRLQESNHPPEVTPAPSMPLPAERPTLPEADRRTPGNRLTETIAGDVFAPAGEALSAQKGSTPSTHSGGSVRVDVEQLDTLMNLVGELVLTRNEMLQFSALQQTSVLLSTSQRLNVITSQLQEGIMKTRMQPIDNVWNKFPRMVRDSALQCGKEVRLEMEGRDTELDRTVIDAIKDPLTHLLRNAIDHGLETPEARVAAGKAAEGRLSLRAFHEGGQVYVEVSDDGTGMDVTAIKLKALERDLITIDQSRLMSDQEVLNLIFLPGFSTAATVTSLSGRGVGMDVVKTNIEKIGGKVSVHTQLGQGTTLKIRIPLTLAIMPALIVSADGERYAIPQVNVVELLRLEGDEVGNRIEMIQDAAVYRLRGDLLPLIWLNAELKTGCGSVEGTRPSRSEVANIVVLQADNRSFGLVVDDVDDTQEIVVKPLAKQLRDIATFAGATIMGNGRVALILDVAGLAVHAKVLSELRDTNSVQAATSSPESAEDTQVLLLFAGPDDARMAVPLSQVMRLESFPRTSLERSGNQDVVQYRGEILALMSVSSLLPERRRRPRNLAPMLEPDGPVQTIVYAKGGRRVGLVVDRILDTVEQSLATPYPASRRGVVGSVVIQGRVTEILDLGMICAGPPKEQLATRVLVDARV